MITSFRHDKQKILKRRKLLGVAFLFAVIFLVSARSVERIVSPFFLTITRPLLIMEYTVKGWWAGDKELLASKESLVAENQHLKETIDAMSLDAYSRTALRDENEQLKAVLGRESGRSLLLARVLGTPGRSPYDTLLIDAGAEEGVAIGMKAFTEGDFALGEVSAIAPRSAVVTLYSSYGNELPVTVGTSSVPATARGEGGGNFRITLPRGIAIVVGDLAHIPALAPEYAGVVEAIDRPEGGSLQDLYLRWPFNINELTWVYVATNEKAPVATKKKSESR